MKILITLLLLSSCITRKKISAYIWLNNSPVPQELCLREPALNDYGLYRKLNDGRLEFVSFCDVKARQFLSMHKDDFERLINKQTDSEQAVKILE